jgi:hypothetical protein
VKRVDWFPSAQYVDPSLSWSSSQPVLTHCQHGLDLRLNPRCYLCRPASDALYARHAALVEVAHTDLLVLIAECLVPMAFAASPDAGRRQSRLDALRAALSKLSASKDSPRDPGDHYAYPEKETSNG